MHHHGTHYTVDDIRFLPRPVQQPGIPVWAAAFPGVRKPLRRGISRSPQTAAPRHFPESANRRAAAFPGVRKPLRRAARCDGLFPANLEHPDQLAEVVATLTDLRGAAATPYDIAVELPIGVDPAPFAEAGATWWLPAFPPGVSLDVVRGVLRDGPA